jgi:putative transcriptional regulator
MNNIFEISPGIILVSEPFLNDERFSRKVVLIVEHNKLGSVGFILNNPSHLTVSQVTSNFPYTELMVHIGGPVANDTLHYIHTLGTEIDGSIEIFPGVYWGGSFAMIKEKISANELNETNIKFFVGYSGWTNNQLQDEIDQKSWFLGKCEAPYIFEEFEDLWKEILFNMGPRFQYLANSPSNPSLN